MTAQPERRRFFATEVVQTSSMDCGPAALKALLDGFRISVSYGRLREACRTDIDGTSLDTLEDVAQQAGLCAEQILLPVDHVLLAEASALPAIAVVRSASGGAHFVVAWRRHGPLVQVMDPARGRLWLPRSLFLDQLFVHSMSVSAGAWRQWAGSDAFLQPLRRRLRTIGLSGNAQDAHIGRASADASWLALAALDAGARMVASLQSSGALRRADGPSTLAALTASSTRHSPVSAIPDHYWTARLAAPSRDGREQLVVRGAVLVRALGRSWQPAPETFGAQYAAAPGTPSACLSAALNESPVQPLRHLLAALRSGGIVTPAVAACAIAIAVIGVVFEAMLLRSAVDIGTVLRGPEQGLWAGVALTMFASAMLALEVLLASTERRIGSHLESRLRMTFLDKVPRLPDAYFQSRPVSDMLERSHTVHTVRTLPRLGVRFVRVGLELAVTGMALVWLNPGTAMLALAAAASAAGIPLLGHPVIAERDLRARTHAGALARFHLDALRGRTALEAHGADKIIEREHEGLLAEWARAALALQRASMSVEALQLLVGFGLAAWMLFGHVAAGANAALLLQAYWMLSLPALGYELALIAREYPAHRSTILRLLEPLGAPDERSMAGHAKNSVARTRPAGVAVHARSVAVRVAGHAILEDIDLEIEAGSHVAVIGSSGAGKSTLAGLLLGWHRPAAGELMVDGEPLTPERVELLRQETAWVDPTVHIWNRSLLDNLLYGSEDGLDRIGPVLEMAGLLPVVAKLPQGLATMLGEDGALLSAGEAQRVRLGRALLKVRTRLVVLDEPFLGLERDRRRALLAHARQRWSASTLLYVTHDIAETRAFDRVLVMEHGRIVEDGEPRQLAQTPSSRYRRMLQAQEATQNRFATSTEWRRLRFESGRIVTEHARSSEQTA